MCCRFGWINHVNVQHETLLSTHGHALQMHTMFWWITIRSSIVKHSVIAPSKTEFINIADFMRNRTNNINGSIQQVVTEMNTSLYMYRNEGGLTHIIYHTLNKYTCTAVPFEETWERLCRGCERQNQPAGWGQLIGESASPPRSLLLCHSLSCNISDWSLVQVSTVTSVYATCAIDNVVS